MSLNFVLELSFITTLLVSMGLQRKYELAYQLAGAVSYLHEEEMVHLDLHSKSNREKQIPGTPDSYVKIYTECWNQEPDNRPTIDEVVDKLKSAKNAKNENNVKNAKNAKNDQTNKLGSDPNTDRSNFSSNDINRLVTNGVVDCIKFKNEIVKPIGTMVNGIINDIVNKNQERELDDVIDRDIFNDRNKNNNVKSQQTYDHLNNQQDSDSNNLRERLNDFVIGTRAEREKVFKMCKEAENVFTEVGDAIEKQDHKKILGLIKKSAEGAVAEILQSNSQNDEETVEIIESLQKTAQRTAKTAQRTAEAVHESPCNVN
ncbi:unnamed protein product [Rhizophagus irregularis]|nr:unnamed protein product [Rhizophagus irregularis]